MENKIYDGRSFVPVNQVAARVISPSKADELTLPKKFYREHWSVPPPMKEISMEIRDDFKFEDLTGRRIGRRTVIGRSTKPKGGGKTFWVVRCVCGIYELHRSSQIKQKSIPKMCCWCEYHEHLQYTNKRRLYQANRNSLKECPPLDMEAMNIAYKNFSQNKYGELTVIGLPLGSHNHFRTWIVRCSCGLYERRKINYLVNRFKRGDKLMCSVCSLKQR